MGGIGTLARLGLNLALQSEAQRRANRRLRKEEKDRRREIVARLERERQRSAEELRRRLAAERARAGAAGVASGASFDAVLRGLERQSRSRLAETEGRLAADLEAVDELFRRRRRRNLLVRSERLLGLGRDLFSRGRASRRSLLG